MSCNLVTLGVRAVQAGLQSFLGMTPIEISDVSQKISAVASWIFSQTADVASSITSRDVAIATTTCSFGIVFGLYVMHQFKKEKKELNALQQDVNGVNLTGLDQYIAQVKNGQETLYWKARSLYNSIDALLKAEKDFLEIKQYQIQPIVINGHDYPAGYTPEVLTWEMRKEKICKSLGLNPIEQDLQGGNISERREKQIYELYDLSIINERIESLEEIEALFSHTNYVLSENDKLSCRGVEVDIPDFIARNLFLDRQ